MFACVGSIDVLIDGFSVLMWIFYGLVFAALLVLRVTRPKDKRPYKVYSTRHEEVRNWLLVIFAVAMKSKCATSFLCNKPFIWTVNRDGG